MSLETEEIEYEDDEDREPHCCNTCGGRGWIVTCIDDMCRGAGECMHGDGEGNCPECNRDGTKDWEP